VFENRSLRRKRGGKRGIRGDWKIITKSMALLFVLFAVIVVKAVRIILAGRLSRDKE
jgi:hypothetical protein